MRGAQKTTHLFEIWIPLAVLLVGSLLFWIFPIDLVLATRFYVPEWLSGQEQPWKALYDYGTWPGLAVGIGAMVGLVLSIRVAKLQTCRKQCLFIMLALLLGPGLFVNVIFKDHWGRPRPRDVENFGGDYAFEQLWEYDQSSPGKSFPCGHASAVFYLFSGFLLLRHRHRFAAFATLIGSLIFGTLVGIARIAQGGHFASDVLWAAAMCWFVSLGLYYLLGLHRPNEDTAFDRIIKRAPRRFFTVAGIIMAVGITSMLLATPHDKENRFTPSEAVQNSTNKHRFSLKLEIGDVDVHLGDTLNVQSLAKGFGVPGSQMKSIFHEKEDSVGDHRFQLKMRKSGFFTELDHDLLLTLDRNRPNFVKLEVEEGSVTVHLPKNSPLRLDLGETPLADPEGLFRETKSGDLVTGDSPTTTIVVRLGNGELTVIPEETQK